ncbi:MAG TPA: dihydrofolate reductase family protein [Streptosporangiaceae bacterium]|jgi:5-amino-6-(5-phosphoribosylamino)uracil reductase|nr:dihydrofolate reductase family protein [Streptosporangiaceae bacterium]
MTERPYVVLSCAISVDGYLDDTGPERLVLSSEADLDRVDAERAAADALMVGAGTIRRDNPRLLIKSAERRAARVALGLHEQPIGVTITGSGDIDPGAQFFDPQWWSGDTAHGGPPQRIVYTATSAAGIAREKFGGRAEVIDAGQPARLQTMLADLAQRGVRRLMVEGGARLGTEFLTARLADELQLVIAPFFVGDPAAPRFAGERPFPHGPGSRMTLAEVRNVDGVVLLRYLLGDVQAISRTAGPLGGEVGHD